MMEASKNDSCHPSILIVDDTPANLHLLVGMLKDRGYRTRPVPSGKLALGAAKNDPPDLILLDINMPEMNGYEVCERLKAEENLKDIPVIFISALNETMDKVKAFSFGGVDYITKPFQIEEVEARVKTHLKISSLQSALEERNIQLEDSLLKLRELEKLRDDLTHMIVHDMRSPLTGILANVNFVLDSDAIGNLNKDDIEALNDTQESSMHLSEMISSILDVSRLEAGEMPLSKEKADLHTVAQDSLKLLGGLVARRKIAIEASQTPIQALCDPGVIGRVIGNLIVNAIKFSSSDKEVKVLVERGDGCVRVSVIDRGPGIPPEYHTKIFEKFHRAETKKHGFLPSTGLGLTFCKLAVEAHGGSIGVESELGKGSNFWFTLPA